jgi:hypothetical protein
MDALSFENFAATIFSLSEFSVVEIFYPGNMSIENNIQFFRPDVPMAANRFRQYKRTPDSFGN